MSEVGGNGSPSMTCNFDLAPRVEEFAEVDDLLFDLY